MELTRKAADKKNKERYEYTSGPYAGARAAVLLGDRMAIAREELSERQPLALDVRDLSDRSTFDRMRPLHLNG